MNERKAIADVRRLLPAGQHDGDVPLLIGESDAMRGIRALIEQVAAIDVPVVIIGESGTGKEVVARQIHALSARRRHAFVPINCGAIPEGLFESEMFGTIRGAYTGADRSRAGLFEQADKGTLLLDEIGEMPLAMQVKLLRVLETGIVTRVGGVESQRVDFRLISSTNRDLFKATTNEKFRLDLYYRIRAVQIDLPPLRDRPEDIPALVHWFSSNFVKRNQAAAVEWSASALNWLSEQRWEGNVRELRWFVEGFLSLDRSNEPITVDRVQQVFMKLVPASKRLPVLVEKAEYLNFHDKHDATDGENVFLRELHEVRREIHEMKGMMASIMLRMDEQRNLAQVQEIPVFPTVMEREREAIHDALQAANGNRREAARKLGISERTLYRKLKDV